MNDFLQTPIEFLKGVGPQRAQLLKKELGIISVDDLVNYFPFRYVDRSQYHTISELPTLDGPAQLKGMIVHVSERQVGKQTRLIAKFQDRTGIIELVWFQGGKWIKPLLKLNTEFQVYGKAKFFGSNFTIPHPEIIEFEKVKSEKGLQAVYSSTEKLNMNGLSSKGIARITAQLVELLKGKIQETLPQSIVNELRLMSREASLIQIHFPTDDARVASARIRLKFEELFFLQLEMLMRKQISIRKTGGHIFPEVGFAFTEFYENHLPFELTGAQKRVLKEIRKDFMIGHHMNRLLQGDVGSGKTLVALLTILMGIGNGFQGALMAPTEILATQHFVTLSDMLKNMDIKLELLTGSVGKKDRRRIHEGIESGETHILVGTHALLEDVVQFKNLGIVVIDEQHRFGVAQRARMWKKNTIPPHVLVMTATPIPRTLAMTFYGDLDVSVIDELPPGRKLIETSHRFETNRLTVFGFMKSEIAKGRQIYVVYPLIKESETLDYNNLMDGYEAISRTFPLPDYRVSIVHGQMKAADKEFEMQRFVKGETQIMVATTVIEVGVNVPNASVMIIESSERFGLSQLHQLRGRVGRGAEQSYCILMTGIKLSKESKKRLETMVRTNDGFEIAEVDLELRGPGDIMGTQQSGELDLKIADLAKDGQIVVLARDNARKILEEDPFLEQPNHSLIREKLRKIMMSKPNWSSIS
jgi:ATP-dependent DNA helicase RecG